MSDVEFLDEQYQKSDFASAHEEAPVPSSIRFLIRTGIVKTPRGGYVFMTTLIIIFLLIAAIIFYQYI